VSARNRRNSRGTEEYQPVFVGKTLEQLSEIFTRYPNKQELSCRPCGSCSRRAAGFPTEHGRVAEVLGLTAAYVKGVVTFYTMYHQHPGGEALRAGVHHFAVHICGAEAVVKALLERPAQGARRTSPDGKWTVD